MTVFWSTNDQRKKRFLRTDEVHRSSGYAWAFSDDLSVVDIWVSGRRKRVRTMAVFDDSTQPPTLLRTAASLNWLCNKRADFPRTYINGRDGDVCAVAWDGTGSTIVMPKPEDTPS